MATGGTAGPYLVAPNGGAPPQERLGDGSGAGMRGGALVVARGFEF